MLSVATLANRYGVRPGSYCLARLCSPAPSAQATPAPGGWKTRNTEQLFAYGEHRGAAPRHFSAGARRSGRASEGEFPARAARPSAWNAWNGEACPGGSCHAFAPACQRGAERQDRAASAWGATWRGAGRGCCLYPAPAPDADESIAGEPPCRRRIAAADRLPENERSAPPTARSLSPSRGRAGKRGRPARGGFSSTQAPPTLFRRGQSLQGLRFLQHFFLPAISALLAAFSSA